MRAALATVVVAGLGAATFWWGTEGGMALTSEAARRLDIAAAPRMLPDVPLYDQTNAKLQLSDYRGAPVVLEFIYATCPDVCLTLGTAFERLDAVLPPGVPLLSLSFDPADGPQRLGWFANRHGAEAPHWRVAGVKDPKARAALLERAGVVVIPDGVGGFVHNAGLYLIDGKGRLSRVFDPEDTKGVLDALLVIEG